MDKFNKGKRFGGERSFGGGRGGFGGGRGGFGGGRSGGRPEMHKATCGECGQSCEVPFRPTGERPVFCSACFTKQGGGSDRPSRFGERRERPRFEDRQMHDATCAKCGSACQVPFRPSPGKQVFCSTCFDKNGQSSGPSTSFSTGGSRGGVDYTEQFRTLNDKLDELIKLLAPKSVAKKEVEKEVVKEVKKAGKVKPLAKKAIGKKKK